MTYADDFDDSLDTEVIEDEFSDNFDSLQTDITHIVVRQQSIQGHLTTLEGSVARIETLLQQSTHLQNNNNANNQQNTKTNLYNALNRSLELITKFNDSYNKLLELKLRYRQEQNSLRYKIVRMIKLEMKKIDKTEETSQDHLMKVLSLLSNQKDNISTGQSELDIFNSKVADIENKEDYEI